MAELKQLRSTFDKAPIDSITPFIIAGYRDAGSAKLHANRSHGPGLFDRPAASGLLTC